MVGVLLIGFALTDGFDMGAMAIMPFVGKTDTERRSAINTIAPHWDGNQVWFITAGVHYLLLGLWSTLSHFQVYTGHYSWSYLHFLRPVGFDYRSKLENTTWRNAGLGALYWRCSTCFSFWYCIWQSLLGIPFNLDDTLRSTYSGSFLVY